MFLAALSVLVAVAPFRAAGRALPRAASASATLASSAPLPTSTAIVPGLNALAQAAGKVYFGSATDNPELNDTAYVNILSDNRQFGQLTPGNSMKWYATEPEPGVFTFEAGDVIRNLAYANGQYLRGHNCVWYEELPDWVTANNYTAPELAYVVENHCATIVGHYAGEIISFSYSWDVINEPLNDNGTFRETVFYDTLGMEYIPIALRAARAADPHAKLFINDYNIEGTGAKSTAMVELVQWLQENYVPIDGIGVEGHLIVGEVPTTLVENFQQFADLGVIFSINELDIRMPLPATAEMLEQQKADYETVVSACMQFTQCVGITLWDYTDKYSWIPSSFPGYGEACPWDEYLQRKPAYDGIVLGFQNGSTLYL
ncbi:endo-1,4-beta-xylanase [Sparassis latifolia]|uniref:Beta-xylanase n=1 Tax=Sparassis crispa TaxID=139825 RepID=A0A401GGX4_9APHY|nr:Endo-1,4-beta-xylanase A [Sparassis crispa]GBE81353.1 Endo-1,4-beta-xylanase A [Sparassis crispa]